MLKHISHQLRISLLEKRKHFFNNNMMICVFVFFSRHICMTYNDDKKNALKKYFDMIEI